MKDVLQFNGPIGLSEIKGRLVPPGYFILYSVPGEPRRGALAMSAMAVSIDLNPADFEPPREMLRAVMIEYALEMAVTHGWTKTTVYEDGEIVYKEV